VKRTVLPSDTAFHVGTSTDPSRVKPVGTSTSTSTTGLSSAATPMVSAVGWFTSAVPDVAHAWAPAGDGRAAASASRSATMTGMRTRRTLVTVVTALLVLVVGAPPASAHSVSGIGATDFETVVRSVSPRVAGLHVRVIELGSRLELRNTGRVEAVVLGYDQEPYLRVGPDGVFENVRSPATYLNRTRLGGSIPPTADSSAAPSWRRVRSEPVARWHDHRIHWMGNRPPPNVQRDPDHRHVVNDAWVVPVDVGSTSVKVSGQLLWTPGPSSVPWLALAVVLLAAMAGAAALLDAGAFRRVFAVGVALVLAVDLVHAAGTGWTVQASTLSRLSRMVASSPTAIVGWVAAVVAIVLLTTRPDREVEGMLAGAFAGSVVAVFGGSVDVTSLSRSQLPFAGPASLARLCVAVSLGVGFGLAAATAVVLRRRPVTAPDAEPVASPA
jgi:hypothetical protein